MVSPGGNFDRFFFIWGNMRYNQSDIYSHAAGQSMKTNWLAGIDCAFSENLFDRFETNTSESQIAIVILLLQGTHTHLIENG